ncbi:mannose-6-phosphatase [Punctularia strigosozonata HHB-11173 SS5]|uniref:mannose-6-phosphatase n=1 Tax=Punctularia strigosozonata (strain HHB-11173) TaxID=741275 RepID=UPI00044165B3|nr:mannose-6-phosphatase [Punctularia strigosozonata HHB-11173 SS5]EIN14553.1 mannose-6-phosphatase [Punctularia strigosozonata HHB-11173 SS5]
MGDGFRQHSPVRARPMSFKQLFLAALFVGWSSVARGFRIATHNLRFDSMPDNITVQQSIAALPDPLTQPAFLALSGEQPWSTRRIKIAQHLISEGLSLFGVQEALVRQVNDLQELFGDEWAHFGVGRDDGAEAGEFSAIYYKKSDVTLLSNDSFWLSNEPFDAGSKFPGAGSVRICTASRFTLNTGPSAPVNFSYLNTHLDDKSDDQRKLAASMILIRARFEAATHNNPVFVTGDFNSHETGSDSGAYEIITGAATPVAVNATFAARFAVPDDEQPDFKMLDLRAQTARINVGANFATFAGFSAPNDTSQWGRIDFVFGGSNGGWNVTGYKVDTSLTDDGTVASDHRPVFADIQI